MKKLSAVTIALLISSSSLWASFDYDFHCTNDKGQPILNLTVSAGGVENFLFLNESAELVVNSQYADYGSLVLAFDNKKTGKQAYQLYLDMSTGIRWEGTLTNEKGDSTEITCLSLD